MSECRRTQSNFLDRCSRSIAWQALTDIEREELRKRNRRMRTYKTSLCPTFRDTGRCPYGFQCRYAHGVDELRPAPTRHPKYKTKLCENFILYGLCPYGNRCQFIHKSLNEMQNNLMTMESSQSFRNIFPDMDSFRQINTSMKCLSLSTVNLDKCIECTGTDDLCNPLTGISWNTAGNMKRFTEIISNQNVEYTVYGDQSFGDAKPVASSNSRDELNPFIRRFKNLLMHESVPNHDSI